MGEPVYIEYTIYKSMINWCKYEREKLETFEAEVMANVLKKSVRGAYYVYQYCINHRGAASN